MPNYTQNAQAKLLYENSQQYFWNGESAVAGNMSVAYEFRRVLGAFYPWGFAVEVAFSATPGSFEVDIMAAETDILANYIKIGSIAAVNTSFVGRFETTLFFPKYIALLLLTLPNAVTTTAKVTR